MPLRSGPGSFQSNVRTLMGEIGKSPHVQSRAQALAIAYAKERGRQRGGEVGGLVDHDFDPDLPPVTEPVSLEPVMAHQHDPAYADVIRRLIEGQKQLNALKPAQREEVRRYAMGGLIRRLKFGGVI